MFYHEVNFGISTRVILILAATIAFAVFYGIISTRIVAGYREVRHIGALRPRLDKINNIKRWGGYHKNGEGRYTVLFSSTSTDGFVSILCGLRVMLAVIKYHWFGIYQTAMNIDGSVAADVNGFLLASLAILAGASVYTILIYKMVHFVQFMRAIQLSEKVRETGEYPHYAQRRSIKFFIECLKADEIQTVLVKKARPAEEPRRAKVATASTMLDASKEVRQSRYLASMQGFYSAHNIKQTSTDPETQAKKPNKITMSRHAS